MTAKNEQQMNERRIIAITGVTRGLGRAMAERFAGLGHVVAGCGRTEADLSRLRTTIGNAHELAVVDVVDEGAVKEWAREVLARYGAPDLLVNNAAVINANAPLWKVSADEFSRVIDVNIKAVANVIRHFVPAMIARKRGVIVNFSSGWGRTTSPEVAPYCATKWAMEGLTLALAQELPAGMAAIPLNPGIIDTAMLRSCFGGSAGGYPKAEEWARRAVPFLLALGPRDNGKSLTVDG